MFTLFSSDETSEGQLLLDVDDFREGDKETHRKTMEGFYDKYRCDKAVDLRSAGQEGTRFAGRRVVQHSDFRISVSMDEYVKSKLRPIEVPRGYLSNTKEISDGMLTNVKGVNGGLGWLASTGRPDMAAPHSIIPSGYDRRSPQLISEVNAAVKQCHLVLITITIWPIPFAEQRWTIFTDSRAAPTRLVGVCYKQIFQPRTVGAGECATLAKSKAHTKSGESTAGGNLCSKFSSGGDDLDQSIVGIDDLETLVMDSKGLFDALDNDLPQDDRKSALDTLKGEKSELADRATLRQTGTVPRHKSERCQIRDGTNLFCSYALGLRRSLSGVREGGAM